MYNYKKNIDKLSLYLVAYFIRQDKSIKKDKNNVRKQRNTTDK